MAKIDAQLAVLSLPAEPARAGLPRRPSWAVPPAGVEPDSATFALAAAAALGVG